MIKEGSTVSVHYTGKLSNGEVFDTSEGREPLQFVVGTNQIIPGFENAILGKVVGETVVATITPETAYGPLREDLIVEVPLENMPGPVESGQFLEAQTDQGQPIRVQVVEVKENTVVINGNHPLAGEDLTFEIQVLEVIEETPETETQA